MVMKRILKYGIAFLCVVFVLSCISIYEHRELLSSYFSNTLSSAVGVGLYFLIFGFGMALLIKAALR